MRTRYGYERPRLIDEQLIVRAVAEAHLIEDDIVEVLDVLRRVELRTNAYHRELSMTRPMDNPDLVGFLGRWAAEETEHGRALSLVAAARGYPTHIEQTRSDSSSVFRHHRSTMRRNYVVAELLPTSFLAIHMTVGAINEWMVHFVYRCIAELTVSPALADLLQALAVQESHHAGQYRIRADRALASSRTARFLVRHYLDTRWEIVGDDVAHYDGHLKVFHLLSPHPKWDERLDLIDSRVACLPGLDGVRPIHRARSKFPTRHVVGSGPAFT